MVSIMKTLACVLFLHIVNSHAQYQTVARGQKFSEDPQKEYKMYFQDRSGKIISPWHDVPLMSDPSKQTYNMIVEIPRFSQAKFEIHREHMMNPIVQDKAGNSLRFLPNVFPWHGHVCNYGAFPQTWENPFHKDEWTGLKGDKDPIDVCEVGSKPVPTGTVLPVKILGILGMLDGGETDWKVIVMNVREADEQKIDTLDNLRSARPGMIEAVRWFFTVYKIPSGKPANVFAYNGEVKDKELAIDVIKYTNEAWKEMINNCSISGKDVGSFNTANSLQDSKCSVDQTKAKNEVESQPAFEATDASLPQDIDKWSYVPSSGQSVYMMWSFILLQISCLKAVRDLML